MRNFHLLILLSSIFIFSCREIKKNHSLLSTSTHELKQGDIPIKISLKEIEAKMILPQLQSFAFAEYDNIWIFLGGMKSGFHGTSFNPPPFRTSKANDSIWAVDFENKKMWAKAVPDEFKKFLIATNPNYYQSGDMLYFCGGYATKALGSLVLNWTSDNLFEINLPNLIQWVMNDQTVALENVFTKQVQSPYLKITGGEMVVINDCFYIIGGHNFDGPYSPGTSGKYSNAIRKFRLKKSGELWTVQDTLSLFDKENLHRRDMNVVPTFVHSDDSIQFTLLGGVFTASDEAYLNPIIIKGLQNGAPSFEVSSYEQQVNQYTCAFIPFFSKFGDYNLTALIGGISYKRYDNNLKKLVIGDNGIPMPFSNIVSFVLNNGHQIIEGIQVPPWGNLLNQYLGSNARFIPLKKFLLKSRLQLLDLDMIVSSPEKEVLIGYLIGGILSEGPTSGTTPSGYVNTYVNPSIYEVYIQSAKGGIIAGAESD